MSVSAIREPAAISTGVNLGSAPVSSQLTEIPTAVSKMYLQYLVLRAIKIVLEEKLHSYPPRLALLFTGRTLRKL